MNFLPQPLVWTQVLVYGAQPGGTTSSPSEISSPVPSVRVRPVNALEHPVEPETTTGQPAVVPKLPVNGSTLLHRVPL